MRLRQTTLVTVAAVLALAACSGGGDEADTSTTAGPLSATLSAEGTLVTITLTNTSDEEITVVRPFVSPNFVRFWVVDSNGDAVRFDGPYPKLAPLEDEDFVALSPGESVSNEFDLSPSYDLTPGEYTVRAEYRNPAKGSHEGGRALTAEPGEGFSTGSITMEVQP